MKVIGLTGGIGTGKSTVSDYLRKRNIAVIDADAISREITGPGMPLLREIRILLGDQVFRPDGTMDRQLVASKIFADQRLLHAYEDLTTKEVVRLCLEKADEYGRNSDVSLVVIDAPLLFECGMDTYTDETWVVDVPQEERISRVLKRDGISREAVMDRIRRQMPADEKCKRANFVIDNGGDLPHLYEQVDKLLERVGNEG